MWLELPLSDPLTVYPIDKETTTKEKRIIKGGNKEPDPTNPEDLLKYVELRGYRTKVETCCKRATSLFSTTCIYTYLLSQYDT